MISEFFRSWVVGSPEEALLLTSVEVFASQLTDIFFFIIFAVFISSLILKFSKKKESFTRYTPALLTSLGILGTFAGIVIGLLGFDVENIDDSIGKLLGGLQTAFLTSLWGIFLSILYKSIETLFLSNLKIEINNEKVKPLSVNEELAQQTIALKKISQSIADENSDASLINLLKIQRADASDQRKEIKKQLEKISDYLSPVESINVNLAKILELETRIEISVQSQAEKFKEFEDRLWRNLQEFADMMSKSATEQVIEALKQVITDFNNNLVEQFGDNFKALNQAVQELVTWQENYKLQLESMSAQYEHGVQAIVQTESSVAHISQEASEIPKSMNELKSIMEVNRHQLTELESHLDAFKSIRDKAVDALPEIEKRIDETITGVQTATTKLSEGLEAGASTLSSAFVRTAEDFDNSAKRVNESLQETSDHLATDSETIKKNLLDSSEQLTIDLNKLVTEFQNQGKEIIKTHADGNIEIKASYKQVGNDLKSVITDMSEKLATDITAISTSFTQSSNQVLSTQDEFSKSLKQQQSDLIKKLNENFHQQTERVVSELKSKVEMTISEQLKHTEAVRKNLTNFAEQSMTDTAETVKRQASMIDQALEKEINASMQQLGSGLGSITQKFTQDYQVLVKEMQAVINANRR